MLKVNTQKISINEFAKKYGFERRGGKGDFEFEVKGDYITILSSKPEVICISIYGDYLSNGWSYPSDEIENLLFDMIASGDVIKEDNQCLK